MVICLSGSLTPDNRRVIEQWWILNIFLGGGGSIFFATLSIPRNQHYCSGRFYLTIKTLLLKNSNSAYYFSLLEVHNYE